MSDFTAIQLFETYFITTVKHSSNSVFWRGSGEPIDWSRSIPRETRVSRPVIHKETQRAPAIRFSGIEVPFVQNFHDALLHLYLIQTVGDACGSTTFASISITTLTRRPRSQEWMPSTSTPRRQWSGLDYQTHITKLHFKDYGYCLPLKIIQQCFTARSRSVNLVFLQESCHF